MQSAVLVFLGAGLGGVLRHALNLAIPRALGDGFPWATFLINATGSLAMGLLIGWLARRGEGAPRDVQLFVATGILGGYTTFSTFSLDVALLYERGEPGLAALYVLLSVALSIAGLFAGIALVRNFA